MNLARVAIPFCAHGAFKTFWKEDLSSEIIVGQQSDEDKRH